MLNQHPLTDTICDSIQDSIHPCDPDDMRAAADWQLEQTIEWLKEKEYWCMLCWIESLGPSLPLVEEQIDD